MDYLERVKGCLLGGAVGDALGAPVEFLKMPKIRSQYGPDGIKHYSPAYGKIGAITDDTQMTLFTLEGMLKAMIAPGPADSSAITDSVRYAYIRWLGTQGKVSRSPALSGVYDGWLWQQKTLHSRRAPGPTCELSLATHLSWLEQGRIAIPASPINDRKGCGGVMRMAPAGLFDVDCFTVGCDLAKLTHGHPSGYLASGFLAHTIHEILHGADLNVAIQSAIDVLVQWPSHEEVLDAVHKALWCAENRGVTPEGLEQLGGAWVAEEALAISLVCALKAEDFAHGVRLAVNHGGDSDSTGAITGNILGALWGTSAIPDEFLVPLELREVIEQMAQDVASLQLVNDVLERYCWQSGREKAPAAAKEDALVRVVHWVEPDGQPGPYGRSYWVSKGMLVAGCYPGDKIPADATEKLSSLLDAGVRTIVNLMEETETGHKGESFVGYESEFKKLAAGRGLSVNCVRFPIRDNTAPGRKLMGKILDSIDSSIAMGSPVFVHCWGGFGRTGTVVGCWLARHGAAQGEALLQKLKHLRRNEEKAHEPSPQTSSQKELVKSWEEGE